MLFSCILPLCNPFLNSTNFKTCVFFQNWSHAHAYPCTVIPDLESSACHLQIKHKGSISCKYLYFATLILFSYYFPFPQSVLTSAKKARLRELIGEMEEDEPEGEAVVGPSGEATTHSSGSTPPLNFAQKYLFKTFVLPQPILLIPTLLLPDRWFCWGGGSQIVNKGREGYWYFMELGSGGGLSSSTWRGGMGAVDRVSLFYLLFLLLQVTFVVLFPCFPFYLFFYRGWIC